MAVRAYHPLLFSRPNEAVLSVTKDEKAPARNCLRVPNCDPSGSGPDYRLIWAGVTRLGPLTATESICRQLVLSDVPSNGRGIALDIGAKAAVGRSPRRLPILETASGPGKRIRQRVDLASADT